MLLFTVQHPYKRSSTFPIRYSAVINIVVVSVVVPVANHLYSLHRLLDFVL